jgi:hypothetical protein
MCSDGGFYKHRECSNYIRTDWIYYNKYKESKCSQCGAIEKSGYPKQCFRLKLTKAIKLKCINYYETYRYSKFKDEVRYDLNTIYWALKIIDNEGKKFYRMIDGTDQYNENIVTTSRIWAIYAPIENFEQIKTI